MKSKSFIKVLSALAFMSLSAVTSAANSSAPLRVVELFTSQGCSSCPRANKFTREFAQTDPDALVLSYGVTYWDYLGWKDTFGQRAFTERQGHYRDSLKTNMYTPQMVVNGAEDSSRFKKRQIRQHQLSHHVNVFSQAGMLVINGDLPVGATLAIVDYTPGTQSVDVRRGENTGRTMTLANVVTGIDYKRWTGQPLGMSIPQQGRAVLVHDPRTNEILAAARFETPARY